MSQRLLYISNGHGEDNHSSHIIRTLRAIRPELDIAALPIVGEGNAYRNIDVPIVGPTYTLPSGGFTYMNRLRLIDDIRAGLLTMTWKQYKAMKHYVHSADIDFIAATGDTIGQAFAFLSGKPFVSFISPLSAMYEGKLNMDLILWQLLKSERCKSVATRDAYTAEDLKKQGLEKVTFGGIPSLDRLKPKGKDLQMHEADTMIALLPGSRTAEAIRNFKLEMQLAWEAAQLNPKLIYRAALVPSVMAEINAIARAEGWHCEQHDSTDGGQSWVKLRKESTNNNDQVVEILCYSDAFSDIACRSKLVVGMAGLAVDQAMAIGKPIVQIAGEGPQFTYAFAEAQDRLLGISVKQIGMQAATPEILKEAARCVVETVEDKEYLQACVENGQAKFGPFGASARIANLILQHLDEATSSQAQNTSTQQISPAA
ncbi:MAG: lipid-A-disaccharide synthase-related protein [Cyanobacteria bacterium J06650_10]